MSDKKLLRLLVVIIISIYTIVFLWQLSGDYVTAFLTPNLKIDALIDGDGNLLDYAVKKNNTFLVNYLLQKGANPNYYITTTKFAFASLPPIYYAKSAEVALQLIKHGAKLNIRPAYCPLANAAKNGRFAIVRVLIEHGADMQYGNKIGIPVLCAVLLRSSLKTNESEIAPVVDFILKHKADSNVIDIDGYTPLHRAIDRGNADVVNNLLYHGASCSVKTREGLTPLEFATKLHQDKIVLILRKYVNNR